VAWAACSQGSGGGRIGPALATVGYQHTVDGADKAEADSVEFALDDETAKQEEAAALRTETELIAQAQYDLDKAQAERVYRNSLAAANTRWTATMAAAKGVRDLTVAGDQWDRETAESDAGKSLTQDLAGRRVGRSGPAVVVRVPSHW
jgi:hypothetical protein